MTLSQIGHAFLESEKLEGQKERHRSIGSRPDTGEERDNNKKKKLRLDSFIEEHNTSI